MARPETDRTIPQLPLAARIGLGLWLIAVVWWFLYYANYHGPFDLFWLKFACISGATSECLFFQGHITGTILPTYSPVLWHAGLAAMTVGLYQHHKARKAAQ